MTVALTTIALPPHEQDSGQGVPADIGIPGQSGFGVSQADSITGISAPSGVADTQGGANSYAQEYDCGTYSFRCTRWGFFDTYHVDEKYLGTAVHNCHKVYEWEKGGGDHGEQIGCDPDDASLIGQTLACTNSFGYEFGYWYGYDSTTFCSGDKRKK
jgi:hypothetical protein